MHYYLLNITIIMQLNISQCVTYIYLHPNVSCTYRVNIAKLLSFPFILKRFHISVKKTAETILVFTLFNVLK